MLYIDRIANRLRIRRYLFVKYLADLFLWTLATPLAFILRLGDGVVRYGLEILVYTLLGIAIKAVLIFTLGLHRQSWHKVGVRDLFILLQAAGANAVVTLSIAFLLYVILPVPRSIPLLDALIAICLLGGIRLSLRLLNERAMSSRLDRPHRRVLIVGAGEAGSLMARELLRHPEAGRKPVGYLDDEPSKRRRTYVGLPVMGAISDLPAAVRRLNIHEVLIAMPSAPGDVVRRVVTLANDVGVRYRIIPGFYDILSGEVSISQIREVDVEDLLRRDPIHLNLDQIASYLEDFVILVTGAGGSIGSEIVRQIIPFNPRRIVLLDRNENSLYLMERELDRQNVPFDYQIVVADIQHQRKLTRIFDQHRPHVVFHAAANKHVSLMEDYPDEAIFNNVRGTRNLLEMALQFDVERFVNISTDKAVKPSSIMGASKRIAEMLVAGAARQAKPGQAFVSVRFGNVLGSNASVVPIFKEQIRLGGPVTVTHPDMSRYFMSIPEATQLVLQAASLGDNGAIYILDMGEPVKIVDLARDLIRLSGLEPDEDIRIEFTEPRPGEKLFEELLTIEEGTIASRHEKIYVIPQSPNQDKAFDRRIDQLIKLAGNGDIGQLKNMVMSLSQTNQSD